MKRYLIAVTIISVLVSRLLLGCGSEPASTKPPITTPSPAPTIPTPTPTTPTPKVIEKDAVIKSDVKEREGLPFYLKVGDRVEGEVSIDEGVFYGDRYIDNRAFIGYVGSRVKDPYGNVVVRAEHGFPWKFAFIAYTDGEYELEVYFTAQVQQIQPSAHLKITIHEGD